MLVHCNNPNYFNFMHLILIKMTIPYHSVCVLYMQEWNTIQNHSVLNLTSYLALDPCPVKLNCEPKWQHFNIIWRTLTKLWKIKDLTKSKIIWGEITPLNKLYYLAKTLWGLGALFRALFTLHPAITDPANIADTKQSPRACPQYHELTVSSATL